MIICAGSIFAVYRTALATICNILNFAINYILLQCIVRQLLRLLHTQYCHWVYHFAVYCTVIAAIRYTLNIAIGYILLQYIVRLLPPFTTHSILPSAIPFCSILYGYCLHSLHTQYCHQLYHFGIYCMVIAVIRYTLNIVIDYIILQYTVLYSFWCHLLHARCCHWLYVFALYCPAIAAIPYTLNIIIGYIIL